MLRRNSNRTVRFDAMRFAPGVNTNVRGFPTNVRLSYRRSVSPRPAPTCVNTIPRMTVLNTTVVA